MKLAFFLVIFSLSFALYPKGSIEIWHTLKPELASQLKTKLSPLNMQYQINLTSIFDAGATVAIAKHFDQLPDILIAPGDVISFYKLANFSPVPKSYLPQDATPQLHYMKVENRYHGIPLINSGYLIQYYNKKFVSAPAKSFDELTRISTPKGILPVIWDVQNPYFLFPFLSCSKNSSSTVSDQKLFSYISHALQDYKRVVNKIKVPTDCDWDCPSNQFLSEKSAILIQGDWAFNELRKRLGSNLGIAPLPLYKGKKLTSANYGHSIFFPKNSFSKQEVRTLAKQIIELGNAKEFQATDRTLQILKKQLSKDQPPLLTHNPLKQQALWPILKKNLSLIFSDNYDPDIVIKKNIEYFKAYNQC